MEVSSLYATSQKKPQKKNRKPKNNTLEGNMLSLRPFENENSFDKGPPQKV